MAFLLTNATQNSYNMHMTEENIKITFANNLARLRKERGLTQGKLAKALNYSDKSISKWEHGDVLPDIVTFTTIAEYFGVSVSDLITSDTPVTIAKKTWHILVCLMSFGATWLVALLVFITLQGLYIPNAWYCIFFAIPLSLIAPLVLSCVWFGNTVKAIFTSLEVWTVATCVYIVLGRSELWLIFILALIMQLLVLAFFIAIHQRQKIQKKQNTITNNEK